MGTMQGQGISVEVPSGWDARVFSRPPEALPSPVTPAGARPGTVLTHTTPGAVLHLASFATPSDMGDFGGGAVDRMTAADALIVLFEFGPESLGQPLFANVVNRVPLPGLAEYQPAALRRMIAGQAGAQRFFTIAGRPFSLYVVIGSHLRRFHSVPMVNEVLRTVRVSP